MTECVGFLALIAGDSLLPSYAPAGGVARAAGLGRCADAVVGGWHDRGGLVFSQVRMLICVLLSGPSAPQADVP